MLLLFNTVITAGSTVVNIWIIAGLLLHAGGINGCLVALVLLNGWKYGNKPTEYTNVFIRICA